MTIPQICSKDNCPPSNTKPKFTTKCFNCKQLVHLPCIGINAKVVQIKSPNIKIFCNNCLNGLSDTSDTSTDDSDFSDETTAEQLEKITIKLLMNEMSLLRTAVEANTNKLDSIDGKFNEMFNRTETLVGMQTESADLCEEMETKVDLGSDENNEDESDYITGLNDDCLEQIFKHLEWHDLLSLADCSKQFYAAIGVVFRMKYVNAFVKLGRDTW